MSANSIDLSKLSSLDALHRKMRMGTHIGRHNEPLLWAQLESNAGDYTRLFGALGYQLTIDPRGFAWLEEDDRDDVSEDAKVKKVRRFALILLALFDYQATTGHSLEEFHLWRLDEALLGNVMEAHRDLLVQVEVGTVADMLDELRSVSAWGFTINVDDTWQLLPAVRRFSDTFRHLGSPGEVVPDTDLEEVDQP